MPTITDFQARVLDVIREHPGIYEGAIPREIQGGNRGSVQRAVNVLRSKGLVRSLAWDKRHQMVAVDREERE